MDWKHTPMDIKVVSVGICLMFSSSPPDLANITKYVRVIGDAQKTPCWKTLTTTDIKETLEDMISTKFTVNSGGRYSLTDTGKDCISILEKRLV